MSLIFEIFAVGAAFVIANLLNEILGELRLAKKDREDVRSRRTDDE